VQVGAVYEIVLMMINDAVRSPRHSLEDHVVQKEVLGQWQHVVKIVFFLLYFISLLRQRGHAGQSSPRRQNLTAGIMI
jgi:hypothetical protein